MMVPGGSLPGTIVVCVRVLEKGVVVWGMFSGRLMSGESRESWVVNGLRCLGVAVRSHVRMC
jgi:hypothetical protein